MSVGCGWESAQCRRVATCSVGHDLNTFALCERHAVAYGRRRDREVLAVLRFLAALGVDRVMFGIDPFGAVADTGALGDRGEYHRSRFSRLAASRRWAGVFDGCSDAGDMIDECRRVLDSAGVL